MLTVSKTSKLSKRLLQHLLSYCVKFEFILRVRCTYFLSGQIQSPSLTRKLFPDIFVPVSTGWLCGRVCSVCSGSKSWLRASFSPWCCLQVLFGSSLNTPFPACIAEINTHCNMFCAQWIWDTIVPGRCWDTNTTLCRSVRIHTAFYSVHNLGKTTLHTTATLCLF